MNNNALKFAFVAIMLLVTFWTSDGVGDTSEKRIVANVSQSAIPTVTNTIDVLVPAKEDATASLAAVNEPPKDAGAVTMPSLAARPRIYPKTNFDVRANSLHEIVNGRVAAFMIVDLETGEEVFSQNATKNWPIASLTKLMTAVIATEKIGVTEDVSVSQTAVDTFGEAGSLAEGMKFKVSDLLKAMLQVSSNDAAVALAESKGQESFIAEMNMKARELGMSDATRFVDPIGLDSRNQSTLVDLQKLIAYIYEYQPKILSASRTATDRIKDLAKGKTISLTNINDFARLKEFSNFLGGKTGFIDESGGNLVSVFSVSKRPMLIMVLGSDERFEITRQLLNWFTTNYAITSGN